jgi:hypothetical protein
LWMRPARTTTAGQGYTGHVAVAENPCRAEKLLRDPKSLDKPGIFNDIQHEHEGDGRGRLATDPEYLQPSDKSGSRQSSWPRSL